eukprot:TRINITY_DN35577_c0_g1_i1.p1 TRINITY_DN35577_c0_g1~~TRINITY_DN35577_c0_g1_i1.p1  ORF type:complete len:852 (+),score=220.83 TRINITY_DN35577_c0_g1_i1:145-2700(+)
MRPAVGAHGKPVSPRGRKGSVSKTHAPAVQTATPTLRSMLLNNKKSGVGSLRTAQMQDLYGQIHNESAKKIGEGSFGAVYKVRDTATGQFRAIKKVCKTGPEQELEELLQEAQTLTNLDHPHIMRIFGWDEDAMSIYMVMEFCSGGEITKTVARARIKGAMLPESWVVIAFRQLFSAICYCHKKGVVHKDLKGGNILLLHGPKKGQERELFSSPPHVVVGDLGLAEITGQSVWGTRKRCTAKCGTRATMAPEVFKGSYGSKCDVWSLGCVLFELLTSSRPFKGRQQTGKGMDADKEKWLEKLKEGPNWQIIEKRNMSLATDFCKSLLQFKESQRPTSAEALQHQWLVQPRAAQKSPEMKLLAETANRFARKTPMQKAFLLMLAVQRGANWKLAQIFSQFDRDGNGTLDEREVHAALASMGVDELTARKTWTSLDYDGNGTCEYIEFASACLSSLDEEFDEFLWQEFCLLDANRRGVVTGRTMKTLIERLSAAAQRKLPIPEELQDVDRQFSFEEFCEVLGHPDSARRHRELAEPRQRPELTEFDLLEAEFDDDVTPRIVVEAPKMEVVDPAVLAARQAQQQVQRNLAKSLVDRARQRIAEKQAFFWDDSDSESDSYWEESEGGDSVCCFNEVLPVRHFGSHCDSETDEEGKNPVRKPSVTSSAATSTAPASSRGATQSSTISAATSAAGSARQTSKLPAAAQGSADRASSTASTSCSQLPVTIATARGGSKSGEAASTTSADWSTFEDDGSRLATMPPDETEDMCTRTESARGITQVSPRSPPFLPHENFFTDATGATGGLERAVGSGLSEAKNGPTAPPPTSSPCSLSVGSSYAAGYKAARGAKMLIVSL